MRRFSGYGPSLVVLATAALVLFAGPAAIRQLTYEQTRTRIIEASNRLEHADVLAQMNQATRDIATMVEPSVVHVGATYLERDALGNGRLGLSSGSGWIYDNLGHIVTNNHVVANAQRIEVQLYTGELRDATLVGTDPTTDIAVIRISPERLHPASLAEVSDVVNQGEMVFAFGSPFDFRFSMSSGVVSGKGRSVGVIRDDAGRRAGYENFIQVDAAINPGNSGGPLTDYRGKVIGMNTAIATGRSRGSATLEEGQFAGIGLAIPIDMIIPAVNQIIESGYVEKSYIGVTVQELTANDAQRLQFLGNGALMSDVYRGGPADLAGVHVQDVVTAVNGREVATGQQLRSMVSSMRPGETARLSIWRFDDESQSGRSLVIDVPLQRLDMLLAQGVLDPRQQSREAIVPLGIQKMVTATRDNTRAAGVSYHTGVLLKELSANSRLAARVPAGSIITAIMDQPVRDVEELISALAQYDLTRSRGVMATIFKPDGTMVNFTLAVESP